MSEMLEGIYAFLFIKFRLLAHGHVFERFFPKLLSEKDL